MDQKTTSRSGTLYVVATPIGNLEDMTFRAVRILREVGLIACEDTRRTRKLLTAFGVRNTLTSLHNYNEQRKAASVLVKLQEGVDVAYVTDAGTPCISDPGFALLNRAVAGGIRVVPIPGASAAVTALSISGLPTESFIFLGFPPPRARQRRQYFASLAEETKTLVLYESPRRLAAALRDMAETWGDRRCVLARELTKVFEEIVRGTLDELTCALAERDVRGEWTIIVEGCRISREAAAAPDVAILARYTALRADRDLSRRDMIDRIARETGLPRRAVYRKILSYREE
jgi:16S rRNA (cytidine1402-2'-O)-methyltransferase